ncbi:MAG: energy-coupling factor transporter transmembrane protein EcfT [Clostridia bacterium]|nr:energy-coupling factor transporter transmembrane protein EcfT [Clostridia bacterium]
MIKDITFGQYYDSASFIHKMDPRAKILLLIFLIVFLFLAKNFYSLSIAFLLIIGIIAISRVPLKTYLKNIKGILPIIIFTAVINMFYGDGGKEIFSFWIISLNTGGIYKAIFMSLRIVLLIIISSVLTYTTSPNDLTDAIERLLSPLKFIGLKNAVHTLAMMMTIALRFIPTLIEETEKIMNAQKARGADLESGGLIERIKALVPILIPLLISSVMRAYQLAEAMECRCYNGGEGRVRMKQLKYSVGDLLAVFICVLFCSLIIIFNIIF